MLLVDSSAWIEYLRGTGSATAVRFRALRHEHGADLAMTEPIMLELLAGARQPVAIEARLSALTLRPLDPAVDYHHAATLFRLCRSQGRTIRSLNDCLIAAVALRFGDVVVHQDSDFTELAAATGLQVLDLRGAPV